MATIIGPLAAGILLTRLAAGWLLAIDAASFAVLGIVVSGLAGAPARGRLLRASGRQGRSRDFASCDGATS